MTVTGDLSCELLSWRPAIPRWVDLLAGQKQGRRHGICDPIAPLLARIVAHPPFASFMYPFPLTDIPLVVVSWIPPPPLFSPSPKSKKKGWWVSHPSDCHRTFTIGGMMHDGTVITPTRLPSMRRMALGRVGWLRALDRWLPLVNRGEELVCIWRIQKGVRTAELILFKHSRARSRGEGPISTPMERRRTMVVGTRGETLRGSAKGGWYGGVIQGKKGGGGARLVEEEREGERSRGT